MQKINLTKMAERAKVIREKRDKEMKKQTNNRVNQHPIPTLNTRCAICGDQEWQSHLKLVGPITMCEDCIRLRTGAGFSMPQDGDHASGWGFSGNPYN